MQTIDELLSYLRSLDVKLWVEGGRLRYRAPEGTMTPDLLEQLREHKAEILTFLSQAHMAAQSTVPPIQPVPRDRGLPLSFAQQRLWFLEQMMDGSAAYNEFAALHLTGPLNVVVLEQSLREIIRRHEILRTTFPTVNGSPVQVIAEEDQSHTDRKKHGRKESLQRIGNTTNGNSEEKNGFLSVRGEKTPASDKQGVTISVVDLRQLPEVEQAAEVQRLAAEEAQRPFDLANGPLLRATLLKLDAGCWMLDAGDSNGKEFLPDGKEHGRKEPLQRMGNTTNGDSEEKNSLLSQFVVVSSMGQDRDSAQEHVLLVTMHHIICDGWSTGIFIREIAALYEAFRQGLPSPLPALPIQYADFACWQRQWLTDPSTSAFSPKPFDFAQDRLCQRVRANGVLETQLNYWEQQLAGTSPLLELPTDRPRPPIQTFRGGSEFFEVNSELTQKLKALSRQEGETLFMTLLATFKILLYRYTRQEDIVVGSPIANRSQPEIEGLIGFFVNTLALRTSLEGNPAFSELLKWVQQTALDAYEHQDIPFERLVEALKIERNLSYAPLFQVMFTLQNASIEQLELPGLTISPLKIEKGTAKFDLTLAIMETERGLTGEFEYNSDLFDAATIKRMTGYFLTLLEGIVAFPEQRIAELPVLTEAERHQILVEWNDTAAEYPKDTCLHELFEAQVERTPEAIAVVFENQQLTYRELNVCANQLAHYLQKMGVRPEVSVGICVERSLEMIVGLLGILKAGGAYVPLDPAYPKERLAFMLEDIRLPVLLTQQKIVPILPEHQARVVYLDTDWNVISQEGKENPSSDVKAENLAYVIYTSGSTGRPKGVMIEQRSLVNYLCWAQERLLSDNVHALPMVTALTFDASLKQIFAMLLHGKAVWIFPDDVVAQSDVLLRTLGTRMNVGLNCVPSLWKAILDTIDFGGAVVSEETLTALFVGGEQFDKELASRTFVTLPRLRLVNLYGPTEATANSTAANIIPGGNISIGRPIANTQIYILDRYLQPVPIGVPGELHIGGDSLARGYINRPGLTREKFIRNPFSNKPGARLYRTGDLARYLPDGNIEFLGRIDHQVKVRGFRIELGEIESLLAEHPAVRETIVTVQEDENGNKRLIAYIVPYQRQTITVNELRDFLKRQLPDYMVPAVLMFLEALPLTPNGKVDRHALPDPDQARPELEETIVAPRNPTEKILADIWIEILSVEQVGINDNFFELGGHSLLAIRLIAQIEQRFGKKLSVTTLFQTQTIAQLARFINQQRLSESFTPLVKMQPHGDNFPFFLVHPGDGNIFCYAELVRQPGINRPVYGLQAFGLDPTTSPLSRFEEMATRYIESIRSVYPEGPYAFGGFCLGGTIALEMARQLQSFGEQVALVALFDSVAPHAYRPFEDNVLRYMSFGGDFGGLNNIDLLPFYLKIRRIDPQEGLEGIRKDLQPLSHRERLHVLWECAQKAGKDIDFEYLERVFNVYAAIGDAVLSYTVQTYTGRLALFRTVNFSSPLTDDPLLGWGRYASSLEVYDIPGDHFAMLRQPNVNVLAEKLNTCLEGLPTARAKASK